MEFKITDDEKMKLKKIHKTLKDKRSADKIKCIILLSDGYSYKQIEQILLFDEKTIKRYRDAYTIKGVHELITSNFIGGISNLSSEEMQELSKEIEKNIYSTSKEVCEYVRLNFGKKYSPNGMTQLLKRLGFTHKKTKLISDKADPQKQEEFLTNYKMLRNNLKDTEKIYFMDGVHPTHNVIQGRAWIRKGKEKEISCNTGRQRVNLNGVYSPIDQEVIIREDDTISSESTIKLFKQIEEKHPELTKIFIVRDNARYYVSLAVQEYLKTSKIEYVPLPSYSPNLNLIERLWKFFKEKVIYNKYYSDFSLYKRTVLDFFEFEITNYKDELKTRLSENFHVISVKPGQT